MNFSVLNLKLTDLWLEMLSENEQEIYINHVCGSTISDARRQNRNAIIPFILQSALLGKDLETIISTFPSVLIKDYCTSNLSEWPARKEPIGPELTSFVAFVFHMLTGSENHRRR